MQLRLLPLKLGDKPSLLMKGGYVMGEQEKYKKMLRKVIDETENHEIQTSEELIQILINEIRKSIDFNVNIQSLAE